MIILKILFWIYLLPMLILWAITKFYPIDYDIMVDKKDRKCAFEVSFIPIINVIAIGLFVYKGISFLWEKKIKIACSAFIDKLYNIIIK